MFSADAATGDEVQEKGVGARTECQGHPATWEAWAFSAPANWERGALRGQLRLQAGPGEAGVPPDTASLDGFWSSDQTACWCGQHCPRSSSQRPRMAVPQGGAHPVALADQAMVSPKTHRWEWECQATSDWRALALRVWRPVTYHGVGRPQPGPGRARASPSSHCGLRGLRTCSSSRTEGAASGHSSRPLHPA